MKTIAAIILVLLLIPFNEIRAKSLAYYHVEKPGESPKRVVRDFLLWYKNNREALEKLQLVSRTGADSSSAYRVNFRETENYLKALKGSGFVSEKYIESLRSYFGTADSNLRRTSQNTGVAEGFGYDLVLKASDPAEILNHLKKAEFIIKPATGESIKVYVRFPTVIMALTLSRSGDTWLIDSLDYV